MLTESLVVAVFGAVVGVLLAYWGVDLLTRATDALPSGSALPYWIAIYDRRASAGVHRWITLVATILSGLVPALVSAHSNAAEMMKEGGRGNSSRLVNIITRLLVIGQIALTAALLIATTLEIRSIRNQLKLDYGYDERRDLQRPDGVDGRRLYRRWPPRFFQTRCSRIARQSSV